MPLLTDKDIAEFKALVKKEFKKGDEYTQEQAREDAEGFMRLVLLVLTPTKAEMELIDSLSAEEQVFLSDLEKKNEQLQFDLDSKNEE